MVATDLAENRAVLFWKIPSFEGAAQPDCLLFWLIAQLQLSMKYDFQSRICLTVERRWLAAELAPPSATCATAAGGWTALTSTAWDVEFAAAAMAVLGCGVNHKWIQGILSSRNGILLRYYLDIQMLIIFLCLLPHYPIFHPEL